MDDTKKPNSIINQPIGDNPPTVPMRNVYEQDAWLKAVSTIPVAPPTYAFDKVRFYKNGSTIRLYIYDQENKAWRYTALT